MLPNTFIIGAPKCGTTSLWSLLRQHPEIFFSRDKEPSFFADSDYPERLGWYESLFEPAPIIGDASAAYSIHPVFPGVPERIHSLIRDPKLIYLVRDPVERAISHYIEHVAIGFEDRPAAEAIADPDETRNEYRAASCYATQVKRYLDCFPPSSLLIVEQVELRDEPEETLGRVFRFLSVDESFRPRHLDPRERSTARDRQMTGLGSRLRQSAVTQATLRGISRLLPPAAETRLVDVLKIPFSRRIERPTLDPQLRRELGERFSPEAEWLREYTGKAFDSWSC